MSRTFIQTYSGGTVDFSDFDTSQIIIEDIAHALSMLCRYTGHCKEFYPVGQHSVHVSELVAPENALQGLTHDVSEAFLNDISSPLKNHPALSGYMELEHQIQSALYEKFGVVPTPESDRDVKRADVVMLSTEVRDLMLPSLHFWSGIIKETPPSSFNIVPWTPAEAEHRFLQRFREITNAN